MQWPDRGLPQGDAIGHRREIFRDLPQNKKKEAKPEHKKGTF